MLDRIHTYMYVSNWRWNKDVDEDEDEDERKDRDGGENMSIYSTFPYRWMILLNDVALFYVVAVTDVYTSLGYCCYWCWFDCCCCYCCCCCRSSNAKWKKKLHFEMKNEKKKNWINFGFVACIFIYMHWNLSFSFLHY